MLEHHHERHTMGQKTEVKQGTAGWWFILIGLAWVGFRPDNDNEALSKMHIPSYGVPLLQRYVRIPEYVERDSREEAYT